MEFFSITNGVVFFFHLDDPRVLKEIMFYLESYNFQICMKWVVINSLPLAISKNPSMKVWAPIFYFIFSHLNFLTSFSQILSFGMLQTLLSWLIILVNELVSFSPSFWGLLQKGMNVIEENVLYNGMNMSSVCTSKPRKPFWATKEFHLLTFQALIEVCTRTWSFVVHLYASTSLLLLLSPTFALLICF